MPNKSDLTFYGEKIISLCGTFEQAIDVVMALERAFWSATLQSEALHLTSESAKRDYWVLDTMLLQQNWNLPVSTTSTEISNICLDCLYAKQLYWPLEDGRACIHNTALHPLTFVRNIMSGIKPDSDLRYFAMRSIQRYYKCSLSYETAQLFHRLANTVSSMMSGKVAGGTHNSRVWKYSTVFYPYLVRTLEQGRYSPSSCEKSVDLFVECCRSVGFLLAFYKRDLVEIRAEAIDAEHLLVHLFGMPTGISGFDDLFGGGIMLADNIVTPTTLLQQEEIKTTPNVTRYESELQFSPSLNGRAVLIRGRFGTGKTLLSLQLAVEVARKGGVAWVMPLEQPARECLYALESMNIIPDDDSIQIAWDAVTASSILKNPVPGRGVLIILKTIKDSYKDFLSAFEGNSAEMHNYPLRLLIADPVNSVVRRDTSTPSITKRRAETVEMFNRVKHMGTNLLLVAEEAMEGVSGQSLNNMLFEQNIADTVIRLFIHEKHNYHQRYIEIMKSRHQREQRGEHPFSIVSGSGVTIYPSAASVNARVRHRSIRPRPTHFGLATLDQILGSDTLMSGDIIVLQGPQSTFKTPLGIRFLLESDFIISEPKPQNSDGPRRSPRSISLWISARDDESSMQRALNGPILKHPLTGKTTRDIRICPLPQGYVNPSVILKRIAMHFEEAKINNERIDRVVIDDIVTWEMNCPYVREDEAFADALINFLRRHGATSLLICGEVLPGFRSVVQEPIVHSADCLIQLARREYQGIPRTMLRVVKTRNMLHRQEEFELHAEEGNLEVWPDHSLMCLGPGGELVPIRIRLYLYSETDMQSKYNQRFQETVKMLLARDTEIGSQDRFYVSRALRLDMPATSNELQIMQLDEFQLSKTVMAEDGMLALYTFPLELRNYEEWNDFIPFLNSRTLRTDNSGFFAVPYYENISLLAYDKERLTAIDVSSWQNLEAAFCREEERAKGEGKQSDLFFDFGCANPENYNCLFFEIFVSLWQPPSLEPLQYYNMEEWLKEPEAVEAARILRRFCRRAHLLRNGKGTLNYDTKLTMDTIRVEHGAGVWRHWYSSLNQMMCEMDEQQCEKIEVVPLPGKISVSGEWYLGIPAHSAAPYVGLEMIKLLTSLESEVELQWRGIGLPVRNTFYTSGEANNTPPVQVSPFFNFDVRLLYDLIQGALRRSNFYNYSRITRVLTYYLYRIIALEDEDDRELRSNIQSVFNELAERIIAIS